MFFFFSRLLSENSKEPKIQAVSRTGYIMVLLTVKFSSDSIRIVKECYRRKLAHTADDRTEYLFKVPLRPLVLSLEEGAEESLQDKKVKKKDKLQRPVRDKAKQYWQRLT